MRRKRQKAAPLLGSGTSEHLSAAVEAVKETVSKEAESPPTGAAMQAIHADAKLASQIADLMGLDPKDKEKVGEEDKTLIVSDEFVKASNRLPKGVEGWAAFFEEHREFLVANSYNREMIPLDITLPVHYTDKPYTYIQKGSRSEPKQAEKVSDGIFELFRALAEYSPKLSKALPPSFQTYATLSYQPDQYYSGTLVWPGIPPSSLTKIMQDNVAPNMIVGLRVDDIVSYSDISEQAWMPGWKIFPRYGQDMTATVKRTIKEAEYFLQNGSLKPLTQSQRRMNRLMPFRNFLAAIVRDTLTYDGIAVWTERDSKGRVLTFAPVSAEHIRLVNTEIGYLGDKNIFAVGVDEVGNPVNTFTADQLYWFVRNPRLNVEVHGYGNSEVQIGIDLIQGFSNVLTMNSSRFTTSSIPNGILVVKGGYNQRTLDAIQRQIINFTRGPSRRWVMPVVASTEDVEMSILDLTPYSGIETLYPDYMSMLMGALAVVYRIPLARLGYRPSGKISEPKDKDQGGARSSAVFDKDQDIGKISLLNALEFMINDALIWPTFPDLIFKFMGKNPIEDARQYQERISTMTYGERRALVGLPPLHEIYKTEKVSSDIKDSVEKIAVLMSMAPGDKSLTGIYQSILAGQGLAGNKGMGLPGAQSERRGDPAESEARGYISGVPAPSRPAQEKKPKEEQ